MDYSWPIAAVGWLLVLWTVLPIVRHEAWWVRVFEFPRVQLAALTIVVLALAIWLASSGDRWYAVLAAALAVCLAFHLMRIAPYCSLYPKQILDAPAAERPNTLSIVIANVFMPNRNAQALLRIIRDTDPDLVLAVETDEWWQRHLDTLEADYPQAVKHPLDNTYGMHLYSRLELVDPQLLFLVEDGVPSIHCDVVLRSGHRVQLHCLHPSPPSPTENPTSAERDAELLTVARSIASNARSVVVTGDLNDVAWSWTTRLFQRISGLLDPRIGRGTFNTFHARYPFLRWPLDHIFASSDFTLVSLARLPDFGSDHFPIHAVLRHSPNADDLHDPPEADETDRVIARRKVEKMDADEAALRAATGGAGTGTTPPEGRCGPGAPQS